MKIISLALSFCLLAAGAGAQGQPPGQEPMPPEHQHVAPPERDWTWTADAQIFAAYNYQSRTFADFAAVESQNWFMLAGSRQAGPGQLTVSGMLSLEPVTIGRLVYAGDGGMERVYASSQT